MTDKHPDVGNVKIVSKMNVTNALSPEKLYKVVDPSSKTIDTSEVSKVDKQLRAKEEATKKLENVATGSSSVTLNPVVSEQNLEDLIRRQFEKEFKFDTNEETTKPLPPLEAWFTSAKW